MSANEGLIDVIKDFTEDLTEEDVHAVDINMYSNEEGIYTVDITLNMRQGDT